MLSAVSKVNNVLKESFARNIFPRGYFRIRRSGGGGGGRGAWLHSKFAPEIRFRAPNFASKNKGDKQPKFCHLNFRYDPDIGILSQFFHLVVPELPKFFLFGDLAPNFVSKLKARSKAPRPRNIELSPGMNLH